MNEVTIVGTLTNDPIHAVSQSRTRFDVAVKRAYFNREKGQYDDLPTVYHRVVAVGSLAENARASLRKGLEVVVVGSFANFCYGKDEEKQELVLEAQVIAPSLRFATVEAKKAQRLTATQRESREVYDGE